MDFMYSTCATAPDTDGWCRVDDSVTYFYYNVRTGVLMSPPEEGYELRPQRLSIATRVSDVLSVLKSNSSAGSP